MHGGDSAIAEGGELTNNSLMQLDGTGVNDEPIFYQQALTAVIFFL